MKKALSLILAALMLISMLAVPVFADASDGFNDGTFGSWGDEEPEEPALGTKENPYPISMPATVPAEVTLAPGASVYYQFPALKFTDWFLTVSGVTGIEQNGVLHEEISLVDRAIKITLTMDGDLVGLINNTEEEVIATLTLSQPLGTASDPRPLEEGENVISVPASYPQYFAQFLPMSDGDYVLNASDYENFLVYIDTDSDPTTDADWVQLTEETSFTLENYMPIFFVVCPIGPTPDITLTVTPPVKGTEQNPYLIFSYDELLAGLSGEGDGMWPASAEGMHYRLYDFMNTTLKISGQTPLFVTIDGVTKSVESESGMTTLEFQMEYIEDFYYYDMLITAPNGGDVQLEVVYPEGTQYNPISLNKGDNTLHLPEEGVTVYAAYTADKDGVLVMKPNTVVGLGYTDATNQTTFDNDYIFTGWLNDEGEIEGASEDFVLTIPVSAGDVVLVSACSGENEDFEILAMDLVLNVSYEGELEIVTEPKTGYAKMGAKVSTKVVAKGEGLTYTWYFRSPTATKYSKSSVTSATYSTTMSSASKGRYVYCIVKDKYGNSIKSKTVLLREAASITTEPKTGYAKMGAKVSTKVVASGDGLTYTWYFRSPSAKKYSKSSVTSATYSTTMSSASKGRYVYCIVKDKYGKTVQSKTVLLRESVSITTQPKTVTVKKNATAKVTVKASGDGLTYTWYIKNASGKKFTKSSIKTASYSVKMTSTTKNRQLYCVVKDKYGKTVQTKTVTLKMK